MNTATRKLLLATGFFAVGVAVFSAHRRPAVGYELSIYGGTPLLFWVAVAVAIVLSVGTTFSEGEHAALGLLLAGTTFTAITFLPRIRGYHFVGEYDALSHLGLARDLNDGLTSPFDIIYPVIHVLASILHDTTTISLNHSLMVVVSLFVLLFFTSVPLVVRELHDVDVFVYVGAFSGLLLLPIDHIGVHLQAYPTAQALLFAPFVIYLLLLNIKRNSWRYLTLFLLAAVTIVFIHPQQNLNLLFFVGAVAAVQLLYLFHDTEYARAGHTAIYPLSIAIFILFWLRVRDLQAFEDTFVILIESLLASEEAADEVAERGVSLAEIGGSVGELFLKLFVAETLFILATIVVTVMVLGRYLPTRLPITRVREDTEWRLFLFCTFGTVPIGIIFLTYVTGGIGVQYFRHLGFLMVVFTISGAFAIGYLMVWVGDEFSPRAARTCLIVVFAVLMLVSIPIVFSSPYVYQSSGHVTEAQISGYETAFEYQDDEATFDHVRSPASRYGNAINGVEAKERGEYYREGVRRGGTPDHFANQDLQYYYDERVHLAITEADRTREVELYQEFRYAEDDFHYLDSQPGINKVQSNDGFDLYLVYPTDS